MVVGVSGGADSVALLLACLALGGRRASRVRAPGLKPRAVHVNHHLRESADHDQAAVSRLCERFGITLHLRHVRPAGQPGNTAAIARRLRYEALAEVAESAGAGFVAVGHHAEDQLETMLMALGRGAALDGLCGMAWSRPLGAGARLVRPMLGVRKSACMDLCRAAGVAWCEDPGNADPATVRARLRRDVLGVFDELWPNAAARAAGVADVVAAARAALEHQVGEAFGDPGETSWPRAALAALPVPVIAAGLRRAAAAAGGGPVDLGRCHLIPPAEAIAGPKRAPRTYELPGGLTIEVRARTVRVNASKPDNEAR